MQGQINVMLIGIALGLILEIAPSLIGISIHHMLNIMNKGIE